MNTAYAADVERVAARLRKVGILPVVELPTTKAAVPLVETLVGCGLDCVEITFRTGAAEAGLAAVRERFPGVLLGAGTVLTVEHVETAAACKADFIVAPGIGEAVLADCFSRGLPVIPGVCTPTEIELARAHGLRLLKFFPAEAMGGVTFLKALCGPYRDIALLPTGGIAPGNLADYLRLPQVVACGGSWLTTPEALAAGDFNEIRELAKEAISIAAGAR